MYVVLSGAKKNAGDFLITARASSLLRHLRPDHELLELPSWEPLDDHLERVNAASAVIILGGPGYQPTMYPGVYKLAAPLSRIVPPVVPLGLGWKGYPGDEQSVASYRFTASSLDALRWMSGRTAALGCRDHISVRVLRAAGIDNAAMNGCATWYDIESLGAPSHLPGELRKIVFTPAQRDVYAEQSVLLAQALRKRFPQARLIAAFHRGRGEVDAFTGADDAANTSRIDASLRDAGLEIADLAGSADTFAVYDDADLHVGYRVHAHLYCSSKRRPSILIHEDGRGRGATEALGTLGIDAFRRVSVRASGNALTRRLGSRPPRRTEITASPDVVTNVVRLIDEELASGFARYAGVGAVIDRSYAGMQSFVAALP